MPFIFISYSHKDSEYANRLADSMEAKGLDVWIDERIDYGARWPQAIQENLDKCAAFAVVMTPDSFESEWVQAELTRARRLRKPTFPLLLEGDVWLALEATLYVDVRGAKLPPASFYTRLREVLAVGEAQVGSSTSRREQLQLELGELQRRYDNLTLRIAAVDTDLGREMDGERRLTLEERRAELAAKRGDSIARMKQIEAQLAKWEEGKQGVQPSPDQKVTLSAVEVAQDESKPKLTAQVRQRARGGSWWLLAGLAAVVAIAVIAFVSDINLSKLIQPKAPIVTPSSALGPGATSVRPVATLAATSIPMPVATFVSEAVILAGDTMTVTSPIEMELVRVPAGEFLMGSDPAKDSPQAIENEQPQHLVNLSEYYIGKYEVTNVQYQAFIRRTGYEPPSNWGSDVIPASKNDHPVAYVSWNDAMAFTGWLSATTGLACRLPTEAEWEKTCRGSEGLIYPWGEISPDSGQANFNNNVGDTTSVGSYSPRGDSPYGVVDMAGNVWEWTSSLWGHDAQKPDYGYPYDPTDGREDLDVPTDVLRVLRGGSYVYDYWGVRCAYRLGDNPFSRGNYLGFRVVCMSPPHQGSGL